MKNTQVVYDYYSVSNLSFYTLCVRINFYLKFILVTTVSTITAIGIIETSKEGIRKKSL
jgi:hypothetical protein